MGESKPERKRVISFDDYIGRRVKGVILLDDEGLEGTLKQVAPSLRDFCRQQIMEQADLVNETAKELARIRKALETWRDEWKNANDPDAYWDAYDTITRINAILIPDEKELKGK